MSKRFKSSVEHGIAIPAALIMMVLIAAVSAMLARLSTHNLAEIKLDEAAGDTYLAAEGAVNKQISEISVLGGLWEQRVNLASQPASYTEYSPLTYYATNGIPTCTGVACHRSMYPVGGGLIKNYGPVNGDGDQVDSSYLITDQLDPEDPPTEDVELSGVQGWTQVERLEETTPSASAVGGSLSNAIAEGGNAKSVRFRITGTSVKSIKGRNGTATVVAVVELPPT